MTMFRILMSTALVGALASCAGPMNRAPGGGGSYAAPEPAPIPAASAGDEAGLKNFVQSFRSRALSSGVSAATYDRAMRIARYNPDVIRLDRKQAEFSRPVWLYLDSAVSDSRIDTGREKAARFNSTLSAIEARYGVPREIVLAVWGMESNFGANRGKMQIIPSLATLAYDGRRGEMFQKQLIASLKILQAGDVDPENMLGSWAGAMGHTQFMPTSYLEYAVDFTGDGRRDIWSDDPTDALASTAAYLARSGWRRGEAWGAEVRLPANFNMGRQEHPQIQRHMGRAGRDPLRRRQPAIGQRLDHHAGGRARTGLPDPRQFPVDPALQQFRQLCAWRVLPGRTDRRAVGHPGRLATQRPALVHGRAEGNPAAPARPGLL